MTNDNPTAAAAVWKPCREFAAAQERIGQLEHVLTDAQTANDKLAAALVRSDEHLAATLAIVRKHASVIVELEDELARQCEEHTVTKIELERARDQLQRLEIELATRNPGRN